MKLGRKSTLAILTLDVLSLGIVFNAIGAIRGIYEFNGLIIAPLAMPALALIAALYLIDGYKMRTDMLGLDYASQHAIAIFFAMLTTLIVTFIVIPGGYPLQQSRAVVALSFVALIPATLVYRRLLYARHIRHRGNRCLVFMGDRPSSHAFQEECALADMTQPVVTVNGNDGTPNNPGDTTVSFNDLLAKINAREVTVEAVILRESSRDLPPDIFQQLVDLYFSGVPTFTVELFHQVYWRKIPLYRLNQTWLFQEGFRVAREPAFERIKRINDIACGCFGLVLATPVFLAVAAAIWFEDRGPVFFKQSRVGKNRVPFTVYKFRSMRQNVTGVPYAQEFDNRITKVGRFLRASRIDEFPQILNVIKGEMSFIGPRAEWSRLVADYEKQIPCYHFRHLVRPGITGWAQVNYPYGASIGDTLRKLEYDLYYVKHFSFTLDASIVLKTIHVMLFGKGR